MSIGARIVSQEDLTAMLHLYDLYKVGRICIYVEKQPHQTLSPYQVEVKEICLPNLNIEYAGQSGDATDLNIKGNSLEGEVELAGPSES